MPPYIYGRAFDPPKPVNMKNGCIVVLSLFVCVSAAAQTIDKSLLCQGDYFTEKQGADHLQEVLLKVKTLDDWQKHAAAIRARLRKGMELEKFPKRTPLNPQFRNKKTLNGYTVESVAFESIPGFYVTGNLYRPTGQQKPKSQAVILNPHGHWDKPEDYGRYRHDMQSRCAAFARMGAIVFSIDMVGFGESQQFPHEYERALTFQTWNSIRSIDFLLSFPEADPSRVAVTGASGGGTQTFMVTALDDRVKVSVPVVMVAAHFFGGCSCESGMPVHRDGNTIYTNAEIACLAAPRPMLLVSDGKDWTKNNPSVEYPFAQKIYSLYGAKDKVGNANFETEGHDYGKTKRVPVYEFLAKHLGLNIKNISNASGQIDESFVTFLDKPDLTFFTEAEQATHAKGEAVYKVLLSLK